MGSKDRVKRLEGKVPPDGCQACGGKIIIGERQEDGSVVWEGDEPCEECGSLATESGQVTRIVVEYDPPATEGGPAWPE